MLKWKKKFKIFLNILNIFMGLVNAICLTSVLGILLKSITNSYSVMRQKSFVLILTP